MNQDLFWRLVWKEYRQQRALWIAIAMAGVILQLAVLVYCMLNSGPDISKLVFILAVSVPVLYSLGCGAALFAGEHEAGTFAFQQALPVSAGRVFFAKFSFAIVSGLLLFPVLWLLALAITRGELPEEVWYVQLWAGGVATMIEILIWSTLASLVLRRVLPSALAGGVAAAVVGYGSLVILIAYGGMFDREFDEYFSTLPLRLGWAVLGLATAVLLGRQWFNESPMRWNPRAASWAVADDTGVAQPATAWTMLSRLLWQEARQARTSIFLCTCAYFLITALMGVPSSGTGPLAALTFVASIFGANVFAGDQRNGSYSFFTEQGVRPRLVWISRQLVWGVALAMLVGLSWTVMWLADSLTPHQASEARFATFLIVSLFAVGQLCSLLIRSGIVAFFTSALCGCLLFFWTVSTMGMGIPWWHSLLPLPLIFFAASWLYVPKWLQQRITWRVRIFTAATIAIPLALVFAANAAYRVMEIPAIRPSFSTAPPADNDSPAARETAAMYARADELLRTKLTFDSADGATKIRARDEAWKEGIAVFLAASRRANCRFARWDDTQPGVKLDERQLVRAVLAEAEVLRESGNLAGAEELYIALLQLAGHYYQQDSSLHFYISPGMKVEEALFEELPDWAAHDSQSVESILGLLERLQAWCRDHQPNWQRIVTARHAGIQRVIALDEVALHRYSGVYGIQPAAIRTLGLLLPWERARMSRLVDLATESTLQGIPQVRLRSSRIAPYQQQELPWDVSLTLRSGRRVSVRSDHSRLWWITTPWLDAEPEATMYVDMESRQRVARGAVQTQIALIAWRKRHEALPESLTELVPDPLDRLPSDPFTQRPFVYFPQGVKEEVWNDDDASMFGMENAMGMRPVPSEETDLGKPQRVRSEPFIWSPGWQLRHFPGASHALSESPVPRDFRNQQGRTLTDSDLLRQGLLYPIPGPPSNTSDAAATLPNGE